MSVVIAMSSDTAMPKAPARASDEPNPITAASVREILAAAPGIKIIDDMAANYFPMPKDASGQDAILVGRIRQDVSDPSGRSIAMFVAGDQLLKGAALNAVQIAECLLADQKTIAA